MKNLSIAAIACALLIGMTSLALAQQPQGAAQTTAAPTPPRGKVAVVDSTAFRTDVDEFREKIAELNRQLESRNKDVRDLADKIMALESTLQNQRQILSASRISEMTGNLDTMKRDYQRKATDLRAYAAKEQTAALEPLLAKLGQFAGEYSAKREIVLLIDLGNAVQSRALIWHSDRIDVTKDFIAEYNKANPVKVQAKP